MAQSEGNSPHSETSAHAARAAAAEFSVDQLSLAFAQLMGDSNRQTAAPSATPSDEGQSDDSQPPADATPDADDTHVTPESIVEAILFVGHPENQPLTSRMMAVYLRGVSPQEVDEIVRDLNVRYVEQGTAYEIVSDGPGYRMALRNEHLRLAESFLGKVREAKLTQGAVDLLAIVAYHQPITREAIDKLRNESSGATLSQLVRRRLLEIAHQVDDQGKRLKVYRTTDRFLALFGLESLDDLPRPDDLHA